MIVTLITTKQDTTALAGRTRILSHRSPTFFFFYPRQNSQLVEAAIVECLTIPVTSTLLGHQGATWQRPRQRQTMGFSPLPTDSVVICVSEMATRTLAARSAHSGVITNWDLDVVSRVRNVGWCDDFGWLPVMSILWVLGSRAVGDCGSASDGMENDFRL